MRCSLPEKGAPIKATGIPPHTIILKCIKDIEAKLDKSIENQNENAEKVVDGVIQELERRAFGAGTVTRDGLREKLLDCLRFVGFGQRNVDEEAPEDAQRNESITAVHAWGGALHLLPENFEFPSVPVRDGWLLWVLVDSHRGFLPFRRLQTSDFSSANKRKRFSDFK